MAPTPRIQGRIGGDRRVTEEFGAPSRRHRNVCQTSTNSRPDCPFDVAYRAEERQPTDIGLPHFAD